MALHVRRGWQLRGAFLVKAPKRSEVHYKLVQLLRGDLRREEVASWAGQWVLAESHDVSNEAVWEALKRLAGADLRIGPDDYLHTEKDFHAWLDELENAE